MIAESSPLVNSITSDNSTNAIKYNELFDFFVEMSNSNIWGAVVGVVRISTQWLWSTSLVLSLQTNCAHFRCRIRVNPWLLESGEHFFECAHILFSWGILNDIICMYLR